jgi:histone H3/H4
MKILYILGSSRCGSTIVDNILNEVDGFFSVGEVRFLWDRILQRRLCGCGRPFQDCPVWSVVLQTGFGFPEGARMDIEEVARAQRESLRVRHIRRVLRASRSPRHRSESLELFRQVTEDVYESVSRVTGARLIVDSSKRASNAALLDLVPGASAYYLHLIRDPRAVAYSRQRRKVNPDREMPAEMDINGPVNSAIFWAVRNLTAELVTRARQPSRVMLLRYEDFVADPLVSMAKILQLVEEEGRDLPFEDERTVRLCGNHTVSGNPARFTEGSVAVREDDEWLGRMRRTSSLGVTALTLPLLLRYGYPLRPK